MRSRTVPNTDVDVIYVLSDGLDIATVMQTPLLGAAIPASIKNSIRNSAAELKIAKYSGLEDKCIFQPIAVESLGPLNETACQFLKDLGRRISALSGDERERECLPVPKVICIQRFNAILLHVSFELADHLD